MKKLLLSISLLLCSIIGFAGFAGNNTDFNSETKPNTNTVFKTVSLAGADAHVSIDEDESLKASHKDLLSPDLPIPFPGMMPLIGSFSEADSLTGVNASSVAWGDYDSDGDLDFLLTGNSDDGFISKIYRNDGEYGFIEDTVTSLPGVSSSSVAWGDYDNDGDLDFLLTGDSDDGPISKIYQNNAVNGFADINAGLIGVKNSSVAWGDYDNDGDLDFLLTGESDQGSISKIYQNNAVNGFIDIQAGLIGVKKSSVAWGDYDNDGDLDILLTGYSPDDGRVSKIYCNNGGGSFTDIDAGLPGLDYSSVAWGDFDNDEDLDLILTGNSNGVRISSIYRNDGAGDFIATDDVLEGVDNSAVAWGDYDSDGNLDLLLTGKLTNGNNVSIIYHNNGDDSFTPIDDVLPDVDASSVAWGDYDNDGDLDILLTGYSPDGRVSKVYGNNGGGSFTAIDAGLPGVCYSSVTWGDYDKDGDLDILLTGNSADGYISKIYKNEETNNNTIPSTPANLSINVSGMEV